MIDPDTCRAIYKLHEQGMSIRQISRGLQLSRNSVRRIIRRQGQPPTARSDKRELDLELLRRLYRECDGWIERVHERLREEEQIEIGYSTLTRILREQGISKPPKTRCDRVPDQPGGEMQHDTSPYRVKLAGVWTAVIASLLYLRYSKRRYLKFYRVFNRFAMKCFLHEALMFWEYSAASNVIDNTNLARLRGVGKHAIIVPEMEAFARRYGFQFICHEIKHSDRKAGVERSFWSVETNFLPGRTFDSLEDLNAQAFEWATVRMEHRVNKRTGLIPTVAFEHERQFLTKLPDQLPAPYCTHQRLTDQYGYVAFQANYYWVPGEGRGEVKLFEYADSLKIFQHRRLLAEYPLPPVGVRNERFSPPGQPQPRHLPRYRKNGAEQEEKRLRAMGTEVSDYVDYVNQTLASQRYRFLRALFTLSRQIPEKAFVQAIQRALTYRVVELETVKRIAWFCMSQPEERLPDIDIDENYRERPAYQEGCLTEEPDLSQYDLDDPPENDDCVPPDESEQEDE
jgi:transposase